MRKVGKKAGFWGKCLMALLLAAILFGVCPVSSLTTKAAEKSGTVYVPMPGFTVEQWSAPKLMHVVKTYNVRELPSTSNVKMGKLQAGSYANVWGQTDTGWYFVEFGSTLGYVRCEAAVEVTDQKVIQAVRSQQAAKDGQTQAKSQTAVPAQPAGQAQAAVPAAPVGQAQTSSPASAAQTQAAQLAALQAAAQQNVQAAPVVFIGDSRMVGMKQHLIDAVGVCPVTVVAQNGARHEWLESTGIPLADTVIGKGTKVVINMGVNDLAHGKDYLELVNPWAAVWMARGAQIYYASVNPVYQNDYGLTEEKVLAFNNYMRAGLLPQITWIDSNSYLKQAGVRSNDGLHYQPMTNIVLYQYYMSMIGF